MRKFVYLTLFAGILLQFYFSSQMPDQVAIHFGPNGLPDSWASKSGALILGVCCYVVLTFMFIGCSKFLGAIPVEKMNIPNKEYWLDPSRQDQVKSLYGGWFDKLIIGSNLFLIVIFYMLTEANKLPEPAIDLNTLYILIGGYIAWTIWLCVDVVLKFKNPKAA